MSAFDAVDGARPAVSKCYSSCVESESNQGGETTANLGAEALKELARTRRRNADNNGGIEVHSSLLNVVLHDQPQIKT
jgi:hypothetical protein